MLVLPTDVARERRDAQLVGTLVGFTETKPFQKLAQWNVVVAVEVHRDDPATTSPKSTLI